MSSSLLHKGNSVWACHSYSYRGESTILKRGDFGNSFPSLKGPSTYTETLFNNTMNSDWSWLVVHPLVVISAPTERGGGRLVDTPFIVYMKQKVVCAISLPLRLNKGLSRETIPQ